MIDKSLLVYPPHFNYKTPFIPTRYDYTTGKIIYGTRVSRDNKYWSKLYKKIDLLYDIKPAILPKGTLLYRCSIYKGPFSFGKSHVGSNLIYFGLDVLISIWIALEIYDRKKVNDKFYLHIYELKDDINYVYLKSDKGTISEINGGVCEAKPCIHPQVILHDSNGFETFDMYNELGTELTFPRNSNYKEKICPIKTYEIDVEKLEKHRQTLLFEWNPANALKKLSE